MNRVISHMDKPLAHYGRALILAFQTFDETSRLAHVTISNEKAQSHKRPLIKFSRRVGSAATEYTEIVAGVSMPW